MVQFQHLIRAASSYDHAHVMLLHSTVAEKGRPLPIDSNYQIPHFQLQITSTNFHLHSELLSHFE